MRQEAETAIKILHKEINLIQDIIEVVEKNIPTGADDITNDLYKMLYELTSTIFYIDTYEREVKKSLTFWYTNERGKEKPTIRYFLNFKNIFR